MVRKEIISNFFFPKNKIKIKIKIKPIWMTDAAAV
jgi:hypothetical protein